MDVETGGSTMVTMSLLAKARKSDGSHKGNFFGRVAARSTVAALLGTATLVAFAGASAYAAGIIPTLGAASPYVILGAASSTSAGLSNVTGDLGLTSNTTAGASASSGSSGLLGTGLLSSGGSLGGSLLGGVNGATTTNNPAAATAEAAATQAYQVIASEAPTHVLSGDVLRGVTLSPGVYAVTGSLQLAGRLVLDARGERGADFIFQIPSDLTTTSGAQIILGAGAQASNVVWQVGDAADLAAATSFAGTILSNRSITVGSGSKLVGRALSLTGAVNLTNDSIALPLVGAVVSAASNAVSAAASVAVPTTTVRATNGVSAATPSIAGGARVSLPLSPVLGRNLSTPSLSSIPDAGDSILGAGGLPTGLSAGLPFIPLQGIGV
ncbi:MAG TPA: ice-binding family protein, partial [Acidimicrobiales bacterium]